MDLLTPFIGPILTALITGGGVYVAITNRLTRLETLIENLKDEVEKHNEVVERTFKLEANQGHIFHEIDDIRGKIAR